VLAGKGKVIHNFYAFKTPWISMQLDRAMIGFTGRGPQGFVPIADTPGGDKFLLDVREGSDHGKIYLWYHEMEVEEDEQPYFGNMEFICNSFSELESLLCESP